MAAIAEIIPPPQAIAHLLKLFGVPERAERALPPPQSSSFQAVASVQVLGHVMVADDCSQDRLRIEFTINVKRANGLQDVIVQRSLQEFELLHKALQQWRKTAPGRMSVPGLPRLKPPGNKWAEWAAGKRGELQRWLSLVVRDQDEFACDELSAFLGVALISFLGVTPSKTPSRTEARTPPAPAAEPPAMPTPLALPPVPPAGVAASGAAAEFAMAMAKGAQPLALGKGGGESLGSPALPSDASLPQGLVPQSPLPKPKASEKGSGEGMRTYVQALEQELHNARQARADEEERRQQLERELREQSERLAAALERERAAQGVQSQRGLARQREEPPVGGSLDAQARAADASDGCGGGDEKGSCGSAQQEEAAVVPHEGYPVGAAERS